MRPDIKEIIIDNSSINSGSQLINVNIKEMNIKIEEMNTDI